MISKLGRFTTTQSGDVKRKDIIMQSTQTCIACSRRWRSHALNVLGLAGLAALLAGGAFLVLVGTAPMSFASKNTCVEKYRACNNRCFGRYKSNEQIVGCINRTCNKQYDNCVKDSGSGSSNRAPSSASGGVLAHPQAPKPKIGRGPFSPTSGGILDTGPGLPGQGPAGTGAPRPPKSGGVIIN